MSEREERLAHAIQNRAFMQDGELCILGDGRKTTELLWNYCLSLLERLEQAERIVRELIMVSPFTYDEFASHPFTCEFCGATGKHEAEVTHADTCPYRRAQQYLEGK